ncbi:hypothetical protein [Paenarthrobacter sp. 4246]|uniref:hypothetical protein n=1 Tax=Paenarthrobacter sp. 4246 TaxID=3156456 RepID=UPI0033987BFC
MPATTLDLGRSAFFEHRWNDALACLARADTEGGLPPQDIELVASVAMLLGRESEGVAYLTRAHDEYVTVGDIAGAARCAAWLVLYLMNLGETARGRRRSVAHSVRHYLLAVIGSCRHGVSGGVLMGETSGLRRTG